MMSYYDYLAHHGVKGQKWGVRRYQNEDGSLTTLGKQRLQEIRSAGKQEDDNTEFGKESHLYSLRTKSNDLTKEYPIYRDSKTGHDVLKKGALVYRMADKNESVDSREKYVSFTGYDQLEYNRFARSGLIRIKDASTAQEYTYALKKDIHIANGKAVLDTMLESLESYKMSDWVISDHEDIDPDLKKTTTYGDLIKRRRENALVLAGLEHAEKMLEQSDKEKDVEQREFIESEVKHAAAAYARYRKLVKTYLEKGSVTRQDLRNRLIDKGYDACMDLVDANDEVITTTQYPLIIFNPAETMKLKKKGSIWNT